MNQWRLVTLVLFVLLLGSCSTPQPKSTNLEPQANYWQPLGTVLDINLTRNAFDPSLAVASSGNPVVSWHEYDGISNNIYVKRWTGSNWVSVGGVLDVDITTYTYSPSLALNSFNNPVVSWHEQGGSSYNNIYVKRWNGTSWVQLGILFLDIYGNQPAFGPSLALNSSGDPVVSWFEFDGISTNVYVKRWNGLRWVQLGGSLDANDVLTDQSARTPSLALDSSDNPVVSWEEYDGTSSNIYVKRWTGSNWVFVGGLLDTNINQNARNPSLVLDSSDNPVVSWTEFDGSSHTIYIKRWDGSTWLQLNSFSFVESQSIATYPSLALNSTGNPVMAWHEDGGSSDNIYVKRYISNAWQDLGNALDVQGGQSAINSSIARRSDNTATVAWDEDDGSSRNVYVKTWDGSKWKALGGALDRSLSNDAENPSVAFGVNAPFVAFQEANNVYVRRWTATSGWVTISNMPVDTNPANDAITPSLAVETTSNLPVIAYIENGHVLVKRANGVQPTSTWLSPYGTLPLDKTASKSREAYRPSLALKSDNKPIVAWYEDTGTSLDISAKEWNGYAWIALGTTIDTTASRSAKDIVLAIRSDNRPVVAWEEAGNIYVKRWTGSSWVALGGALDELSTREALRPAIDLRNDNNPVVTWQEWNGSSYDVLTKRWTGSAWVLIGSKLDKNPSQSARRPALVLKSDNNPIISWDEGDGVSENIYVKQF